MYATTRKEDRLPLFFGPESSGLFGCLHQPPAGAGRDRAVVVCHPFGQEYLRSHRALVQLAGRLAVRGYPVLRFDMYGCGDSAGEANEGGVERWISDVAAAVDEVRVRTGCTMVTVIGLRLGAALAALACAARRDVDSLVLWAPVVDGGRYLEELRGSHAAMLRYEYVDPALDRERGTGSEEVLGFLLPQSLRSDFESLDLRALKRAPAERVLLIDGDSDEATHSLRDHLAGLGTRVDVRRETDRRVVWHAEPARGLVPAKLLDFVGMWLDGGKR